MRGGGADHPSASVDEPVGELVGELVGDRPRTAQQWEELFAGSWPAYVDADPVAARALPRVRERFAHLEVALTRAGDGQLVAAAWGVPVVWDGDPGHLPGGYSDALVRALEDDDGDARCDALVVCAAQVHPALARTGTAALLLRHLLDVGGAHGLHRAVAPLRLTEKHEHPLTPVEEYARWRRADGQAQDPWLRTHERAGARVVATTGASQTFEGTAEQWRAWSGLPLPASGEHLVPGALAPLHLDLTADLGVLAEPGVWVRHR